MNTMMNTQQSANWTLPAGQALRLPVERFDRWLRVLDGEVWLTLDGTPGRPAHDCWLERGALVLVPAGRDAVVEGHPHAHFELFEPGREFSAVSLADPGSASLRSRWSAWVQRLSFAPAQPCEV